MVNDNPLKRYFRQPAMYLHLPTGGKWYQPTEVEMTAEKEIPVYGMTAIDEVMLNTPDAMLNGQALEKVIANCVPSIKNVKKLLIPDIEALFLGMKISTGGNNLEIERKCEKCEHENNFEINCQHLLDTMTYVEDSDSAVRLNNDLMVYVKPYSFEMRHEFLQREFEEERILKAIDESNKDMDEFAKANVLGESVERLSKMTFGLVSKSIERVVLVKENVTVTDPAHIAEWLISINRVQAESILGAVNTLNTIGINKTVPAKCESCGHEWEEQLSFDPTSFFGRR